MSKETKYILIENGKETGPFTAQEIQRRINAGEIFAETVCIPKTITGVPSPLSRFFPEAPSTPIDKTTKPTSKPESPLRCSVNFLIFGGLAILAAIAFDRELSSGLIIPLFIYGVVALAIGLIGLVSLLSLKVGTAGDRVAEQRGKPK